MFQRAIASFLALIVLSAFATYWFYVRMRPEEIAAYHNLIQESTELRTRHALEEKPAHQSRQGVQKDLWSADETQHIRIQSEHSELTLSQEKEKIQAIEELTSIRCSIGGDTLTADEGTYSFPSHQFIARSNCHLTQDQNQIDGTRIHFNLAEEIVTYDNPRGTLANGPSFTANQLIWHKKTGKLYLTDHVTIEQPNQFTLEADSGVLSLNEFQPQLLTLEGHVHLISPSIQGKESYAVADTLTYHPLDKTIRLSSPKKVLFWQEGLSLSASEVLIRQNQTVEGHGDVHFVFDLEEQNYIEQLFGQYL